MKAFMRGHGSGSTLEEIITSDKHPSPIHSQDIAVAAEALAHATQQSKERAPGTYNSDFTRKMALELKVKRQVSSKVAEMLESNKSAQAGPPAEKKDDEDEAHPAPEAELAGVERHERSDDG